MSALKAGDVIEYVGLCGESHSAPVWSDAPNASVWVTLLGEFHLVKLPTKTKPVMREVEVPMPGWRTYLAYEVADWHRKAAA